MHNSREFVLAYVGSAETQLQVCLTKPKSGITGGAQSRAGRRRKRLALQRQHKQQHGEVFISHKNTDVDLAEKIARRVRFNGLETYLDTIDDALAKDGPDLADLLLARMGQCQQLIAVVSSQTKDSWWVPWEIGVGSEKGFRMASYSETNVSLPSYLEKWPALHTDLHIDLYCYYSKQTEEVLNRRMRGVLTEGSRVQVRKSEALDFHKQLRAILRSRTRG